MKNKKNTAKHSKSLVKLYLKMREYSKRSFYYWKEHGEWNPQYDEMAKNGWISICGDKILLKIEENDYEFQTKLGIKNEKSCYIDPPMKKPRAGFKNGKGAFS